MESVVKNKILTVIVVSAFSLIAWGNDNPNYSNNRYPLVRKPYMELPLGSIRAKGWLLEMLQRQKNLVINSLNKIITYESPMILKETHLSG